VSRQKRRAAKIHKKQENLFKKCFLYKEISIFVSNILQ